MHPIPLNVAVATVALAAQALWPTSAAAQERSANETRWGLGYWNAAVRTPSESVELTLASTYVQGVGRLEAGPIDDLATRAGGGLGTETGIGYRFSPRWMAGVSGAYELYSTGAGPSDSLVRGAVVRAEVALHLSPYSRTDPWVRAGSGYRLFYDSNPERRVDGTTWHGLELVRASGGVDLRVDERLALGPTFGMDLSLFLWRNEPIAEPRVSTFAYLGLQGRFDLGSRFVGQFGVAGR